MILQGWHPTLKQAEALEKRHFEILFGGARGGGKSVCGMAWLLYDIVKPKFRALVIRRNAEDLKDWIDKARDMYLSLKCNVVGSPVEFRFPNGAVIRTGHLKDDRSFEKYQGQEYHRIVIEELTHISSEERYLKLISSCRSVDSELPAQVFCTTNPGGAGMYWVKKRWQIPDIPEGNVETMDDISKRKRIFIPSKIDDNPHLIDNDPDYIYYLESLPEGLKEQWRNGYWTDVEIKGAYYSELLRKAGEENRITKVPYDPALKVITSWDLGVNDTTAIWFVQVYGKEVRLIDCYENSGEGLAHYLTVLREKKYDYDTHYFPFDLRVKELSTGTSREDKLIEYGMDNYQILEKLPIEDGIEQVRAIIPYCWFDKEKCREGLNALKSYRKDWDENRLVYRNQPLHDWSSNYADSARYLCQALKTHIEKKAKKFNYTPKMPVVNRITGEKIDKFNGKLFF